MILLLEILQLSKIDQNSQDLRKCKQSEKSDWKNNITKISPSSYSKAWRIISTCMEQNLKDSGNQEKNLR
jgi:hypothetical protein